MQTALFDYPLPPERIAQTPATRRDASRLFVLPRACGEAVTSGWTHRHFAELPEFLRPGDCLVLNDARVIPGRLTGHKDTGGRVLFTLLRPLPTDGSNAMRWEALTRSSKPLRLEVPIRCGNALEVRPARHIREGLWEVDLTPVDASRTVEDALSEVGQLPLPPYIRRPDPMPEDEERYQTVFATHWGAAAAPTAGLHFTEELLDTLRQRGVHIATLTLDVGWGTFAPIRTEAIEDHTLCAEQYTVPAATAETIATTRRNGGRVIAVGTTVVRTLETTATDDGAITPGEGASPLYIQPGRRFRVVDALLTNFHMPRSSLLVLVAAFGGRAQVLAAYDEALRTGYRFLSYGDAMLILPAPVSSGTA